MCVKGIIKRGSFYRLLYFVHTEIFKSSRKSPRWQNNTSYRIDISGTSVFGRKSGHLDRLIQESIEKRLNKDNFNRVDGFILSQAWSPVTSMLLKGKQDQAERVLDSSNEPSSYRHQL
jgi:hypothetical protein